MEFIAQLWPAILLSAGAAWLWSFLSWAILSIHRNDMLPVPGEARFLDAVRPFAIPPGYYAFPHANKSECKNPEFMERWKAGPLGILHVWNPKFSMGRNMFFSFLVYTAVSLLMAYVGNLALPHGAPFAKVMQVMSAMGVLAYCFSFLPGMIWFQGPGRVMLTNVFDGLMQGLATGAVFAAMWPKV